mmetsp:Transcript_12436/g.24178  ORF Transcript_12436/g.24178 Transcript_12436/m.24178 type:complete len:230 (-) Transcript_12436:1034-1723(-)
MHWLLTSRSDANFSRCSWSRALSCKLRSFSISRSFFCNARTLRRTASLSPRSMTFGFGPCRLETGGCFSSPLLKRSLCSMRSARGTAKGMSRCRSLQNRLASSLQLSPTLQSSKWLPHAVWISKSNLSGCSRIAASFSSLPRASRTVGSDLAFSRCWWSRLSIPRDLSRSISRSLACIVRTRRLTTSRLCKSTSMTAAPASVPSRISGGGIGNTGAGKVPGGTGRQRAP